LAGNYLEQDGLSYDGAVRPQGAVFEYATPEGAAQMDHRVLHASTLWWFLHFLGGQSVGLREGLRLWMERKPLCAMHRVTGDIAPHKHRSPQRGETLRIARRLLCLIAAWAAEFERSFFPRFATRPRVP
jgi:hypothetical protein